MGYFARVSTLGKLHDETTNYNEAMFMARNLAKGDTGSPGP